MSIRSNIWTFLLVTLVTVLIWYWAAGETRSRTDPPIESLVQVTVPDPENWLLTPAQRSATIVLEGSQLALQKATARLRQPLVINVSATPGRQVVDLLERVRRHDELLATGATVVSITPPDMEITLDRVERFAAPVKPMLPGVSTEGEIVVEPREVMVAMPSQLRQRLGPNFAVEAALERAELDRVQPGAPTTLDVKLRLPEGVGSPSEVVLTPSRVKMTFAIRSRTREVRVSTVRVQLSGPPEDRETYLVEMDPRQLPDVTITADADLVRRIEANEVPVVALLHIGSREKEARIESKRITCYLALVPEPNGGTRGVQVSGRIGDSTEMPLIRLNITPREVKPTPDS